MGTKCVTRVTVLQQRKSCVVYLTPTNYTHRECESLGVDVMHGDTSKQEACSIYHELLWYEYIYIEAMNAIEDHHYAGD